MTTSALGVEAMKKGALEFLTKPFHDQDLLDAIQHGIGLDRARTERGRLSRSDRYGDEE